MPLGPPETPAPLPPLPPLPESSLVWTQAEEIIREYIESQWVLGLYSTVPLVFENEFPSFSDRYMIVNIEGRYAEKTIYGDSGFRASQEGGMVYYYSLGQGGVGKGVILRPCIAMGKLLELRVLEESIYIGGASPPGQGIDRLISRNMPQGEFYRCSGSVPFILITSK